MFPVSVLDFFSGSAPGLPIFAVNVSAPLFIRRPEV